MKKKVPSRPFFRHPAAPPETTFFLVWPERATYLVQRRAGRDGETASGLCAPSPPVSACSSAGPGGTWGEHALKGDNI